MNKNLKLFLLIAASLLIVGCIRSNKGELEPYVEDPKSNILIKEKQIKTIFIPIGGYTSGFIYCGFDGDKGLLQEMASEGWLIKNIIPQSFTTSKRNGDIVICNGNSYILEK